MLIQVYIVILSAIVLSLGLGIYHNVRNQKTPLAGRMVPLQMCAVIAILGNILFVASHSLFWSNIGFSLFSAAIDWMLIAFYLFVVDYVLSKNKRSIVGRVVGLLAVIDSLSLMANAFFQHVFHLESKLFLSKYTIYEAAEFTPVYYAHLLLCYLLAIEIGRLLIRRACKSSRFYRSKYLAILFLYSILLVVDALCVIFHVPLNASIIFYGGLALALSYYTLYYQPRRLLNDVLQIVMKNINNGIVCFDDTQSCIYANDVVWEMFHLEKDIRILEEFTYAGQRAKASMDEPFSVWQEERVIGGERKYFEIERQNIYDKKGIFVGSYFNMKDQTERQLLHEKEINSEKEANRAKSEFLSRVSHDIRTPINSISGMNEMILRENKDAAIQEYAEHIEEAVGVLINLINDVLDYSKIEAGKMTFVERDYNTGKLLDSVIHIIGTQAEKKGLALKCEISEELPCMLSGDDIKLRQILINILSNAVKYTPQGSVTFRVWGEKEEAGDFYLAVQVQDTGIGIKKEDIPRLFSAFERFEESKNHSIQGTGLGLNITACFLKMMGSQLEVESEYGKGSVFSFRIRQKVIDESTVSASAKAADKADRPHRTTFKKPGARVLVVDDNRVNRKVFMALLKETKMRIDQAESGEACLRLVQENYYNLIFLDHMMPDMDGIETLRKMQELSDSKCKDTPVIMLTANTMESSKETYLEAGFHDFLTKPVDFDVLEETLRKYLG